MIEIKNISVKIEEKILLDNISMHFELGKNYCILGKNGSGKSSLAMTIMGNPKYTIEAGDITYRKKIYQRNDAQRKSTIGYFSCVSTYPRNCWIEII
jgi:Fe-S cluster assembly ATP-binding protein